MGIAIDTNKYAVIFPEGFFKFSAADKSDTTCFFIPFKPPPKQELPKWQLDTEWLRKNGMAIKSTFSWTSVIDNNRALLRRHAFDGAHCDKSKRPRWERVVDEDEDWRTAYRLKTPEMAEPHIATLVTQWQKNRHIAFITGIHVCLGATLARIEGRLALGRLVSRFPKLAANGEREVLGLARFRGYTRFPVRVV